MSLLRARSLERALILPSQGSRGIAELLTRTASTTSDLPAGFSRSIDFHSDHSCTPKRQALCPTTPAADGGSPWLLITRAICRPPFVIHVLAVRPGAPKVRA